MCCPLSKFKEGISFITENLVKNDEWTLYISGDFNLPVIDWNTLSLVPGYSTDDQRSASLLLDFKTKLFLSQYISVETRKVTGQSGNTLDLFFTNDNELFQDILTHDTIMSDHKLITIDLGYNPCLQISNSHIHSDMNQSPCSPESLSQFNFSQANFLQINEELISINWDQLQESNSHEDFVDVFYETVFQVVKRNVPLKAKYLPPSSKPHTSATKLIRTIARKRRKIRQRIDFLNTFQPFSPTINKLKGKLKYLEVKSKDTILKNKNLKERKAIENIKANPRHFYSYAKKFSKRKCKVGPLKVTDKHNSIKVIKHPKRMADVLQNQFKSVFSDPSAINVDNYSSSSSPSDRATPSLESFDFSPADIAKAISEISSSSSAGEDGFPAILLKSCCESLAYPIFFVWKTSFSTGVIHKKFLTQMITPVHKKGSKANPENFRPISLTSHIVKIFERIVRDKLIEFLESNDLLNSFQHGFRHGRSCLSELLAHFDEILKHLNEGNDVDVIYLDFAKAFDKVDHKLLLKKLRLLGISGKVYEWIESFLSNRYQSVVINGFHSFILLVISGVPQGTVLGPILFLIYLNDMDAVATSGSTLRSFADDSRLLKSISTHLDAAKL